MGLLIFWPIAAYRARRLFFRRIWRSLRGFLLGLEIANVTVPTRRTVHSLLVGVLFSVSIDSFPTLPTRHTDYSGYFNFLLRGTAGK